MLAVATDGPVFSTPRKELKKVVKKTNVLDKKRTASQMKTASHDVSDGGPAGLSEEEVKERVDEAVSAATKAYVSHWRRWRRSLMSSWGGRHCRAAGGGGASDVRLGRAPLSGGGWWWRSLMPGWGCTAV